MPKNNLLKTASFSIKTLITAFLVSLWIGYGVAILQVHSRTGLSREQTVVYFRGNEADPDSLQVPQSYGSLVSVAHTHSFSQPLMLVLVGFIFALTGLSERTKATGIVLFFLSSLASSASPFLIRYAGAGWVWLLEVSGVVMMATFVVMSVAILKDVWKNAS